MKYNIVRPIYTKEDIDNIYYGKKGRNTKNPAYVKIKIMSFILFAIWVACIVIGIKTDLFLSYEDYLMNLYTKIIQIYKNPGMRLFGFLGMAAAIFITYVILPIKFGHYVIHKIEKRYQKKNLLIPIYFNKYLQLEKLYKETKNLLERIDYESNLGHDMDIVIKDRDTIRLVVHGNLVMHEYEYTFANMVHKIFKSDVIDFSVIDREWENAIMSTSEKSEEIE